MYRLASHIPRSEVVVFFCSEFGCKQVSVRNKLSMIRKELNVGAVFRKWRQEAGDEATLEELERLLTESKTDKYSNNKKTKNVQRTINSKTCIM